MTRNNIISTILVFCDHHFAQQTSRFLYVSFAAPGDLQAPVERLGVALIHQDGGDAKQVVL
jgi:hypothetical protein